MDRPKIPEFIKREVRKKCGYSCIFCEEMAIDYEHIDPYAEVQCHEADNIVLLCVTHHREVTSGRKSKESVKRISKNPFSLRSGKRAKYRFESEANLCIDIGGNRQILHDNSELSLFSVDNHSVFSVRAEAGVPLFSLSFRDPRQDAALEIYENEFIVNPNNSYDCKLHGRRFQVYGLDRRMLIDVILEDSQITFRKMHFMHNSVAFRIEKDFIAASISGDSLAIMSGMVGNFSVASGKKCCLFHFVSRDGLESIFNFTGFEQVIEAIRGNDENALKVFFKARPKNLTLRRMKGVSD